MSKTPLKKSLTSATGATAKNQLMVLLEKLLGENTAFDHAHPVYQALCTAITAFEAVQNTPIIPRASRRQPSGDYREAAWLKRYQARTSGTQQSVTPKITPGFIALMARDELIKRIRENGSKSAAGILDRFNQHYAKQIADITNPSPASSKDRRPPGRTRRP